MTRRVAERDKSNFSGFIYGSWDGRLTFAEPMTTKAFIASKP